MRIILVALLLYSLTGFVTVSRELRQSELMAAQMRRQTEELRLLNGELEEKIAQGQSPEEMQQLARDRLGLVLPGEKLFYFSTDREG
ncbi:MAG TPA: septum formation initiator family protein [Candidatus Limivicinus faecipullorum]|nr:septum formation initiator family protein [Candidatus Limivicinus faecipullorum]